MNTEAGNEIVCSVCIANYNGLGLIDACIAAVRNQNCDFTFEIIVHDDASTDGSSEHIRKYYPEVRLIESRENVGFCVANNRMAAATKGTYLLLLNNDAELFPDALALLNTEAVKMDRPAILSLPQYDARSGELLDVGSLHDPFLNPIPNRDRGRRDVGMVAGACLWMPRTLWNELGGFPEWFGSVGEDLYLCCRARLAGCLVRVFSTSGYYHHVGKSLGGGKSVGGLLASTYRRRALSERNKSYVMILCYPLALLAILLPLHFLLLLLEGAILSLLHFKKRPLTEIYIPAVASCWRERRRLHSLRKRVQAGRAISLSSFLSQFTPIPRKLFLLFTHGIPKLT